MGKYAQQKFIVKIPKSYTAQERKVIAQDIIDHVVERSRDEGKDKNNKKFVGYKKSYTKSLDFKLGGKGKKVNLTLSGEMLDSLQLLKHREGEIEIGYKANDQLNGQVEGNVLGTYGQQKAVQKPRDFLGIHKSNLKKILEQYPLNDEETRRENIELALESTAAGKELLDG